MALLPGVAVMIWQIYALLFGLGVLMLFQGVQRASPISAAIAALTWGYVAVVSGSLQVVTNSGVEVNFGYRSLVIFCILLALASIFTAFWAYSEEAQETVQDHRDGYSLGGQ